MALSLFSNQYCDFINTGLIGVHGSNYDAVVLMPHAVKRSITSTRITI